MIDIEAGTLWAAEVAAQLERRLTRLVNCRQVAPTPRAETLLATPVARLDRCPPRDPNPRHRRLVPRTETVSRRILSTSSPPPALRQRAQRPHDTPSYPCRTLPRLDGATRAPESHPARPRPRSLHPAPCDRRAITARATVAGLDDAPPARRALERDARSTADGSMHTPARHAPAIASRAHRAAPLDGSTPNILYRSSNIIAETG